MTPRPTITAAPSAARSLRDILGAARTVDCGQCRQSSGQPCAYTPAGADGVHVGRLARAFRGGLVSGQELITVLQAVVCFTARTVVYQDQADDEDAAALKPAGEGGGQP